MASQAKMIYILQLIFVAKRVEGTFFFVQCNFFNLEARKILLIDTDMERDSFRITLNEKSNKKKILKFL